MTTIHLSSFAPANAWPATPYPAKLIRSLINGFLSATVRREATDGAHLPGGETVSQSRDRHVELYTQAERVMSII